MSWVTGTPASPLDLQPETFALWRDALRLARTAVAPGLLDAVRGRLEQAYGGGSDAPARTHPLAGAAADYAEQLSLDPSAVAGEPLEAALGRRGLADLAMAAYAEDADLRMRALLGLGPEAGDTPPGPPEPRDHGELFSYPGVTPAVGAAFARFGNDARRHGLVDALTTEACRLRNALRQQCRY